MRVSVAKAMNTPESYDTSYVAVCNLLESKTGLDKGTITGTVFNAVAEYFQTIIENYDILTVSVDLPDGFVSEEYGVEGAEKTAFSYSLNSLRANQKNLLHDLETVVKTWPLVKALGLYDGGISKEILAEAIASAADVYNYDGVLTYAFNNGMLG
jgi:hypothetical protein